jgi:hypothetical protein
LACQQRIDICRTAKAAFMYSIDGLDRTSSPMVAERWAVPWSPVALAGANMVGFARLIVTL